MLPVCWNRLSGFGSVHQPPVRLFTISQISFHLFNPFFSDSLTSVTLSIIPSCIHSLIRRWRSLPGSIHCPKSTPPSPSQIRSLHRFILLSPIYPFIHLWAFMGLSSDHLTQPSIYLNTLHPYRTLHRLRHTMECWQPWHSTFPRLSLRLLQSVAQ